MSRGTVIQLGRLSQATLLVALVFVAILLAHSAAQAADIDPITTGKNLGGLTTPEILGIVSVVLTIGFCWVSAKLANVYERTLREKDAKHAEQVQLLKDSQSAQMLAMKDQTKLLSETLLANIQTSQSVAATNREVAAVMVEVKDALIAVKNSREHCEALRKIMVGLAERGLGGSPHGV